MKANRMGWFLLFLLGSTVLQLPAQQSEADRKLLLAELRAKAEKGDAMAQCDLGIRYDKGEGVTKDAAEAVKWFRKAADGAFLNQ
jgi:TPR repeat protein